MIYNVEDFRIGQEVHVNINGQYVKMKIASLSHELIVFDLWGILPSRQTIAIERADWETLIKVK